MFREMRRENQKISEEECKKLLAEETRGVISVIGDDDYPYGTPINHYYNPEDNKLYFHGATFGHRIDAIKDNPKVSYCVFDEGKKDEGDWAYRVKSVVIFGKARIIEDRALAMDMCLQLCRKFPCTEEYIKGEFKADADKTLVYCIDIEHMTGKLVHEA